MTTDLYHGVSWEVIEDWPEEQYSFNCVLTDPPYGMDFQSTYGKDEEAREAYQSKIEDDHSVEAALGGWKMTMDVLEPHLAEQCEMYVFSHWHVGPEWQTWLREEMPEYGFELRQLLIWEKGYPGIGDVKTNWGAGHEYIFYLKRGARPMPYRRSGVIHVDKVRPGTNVHPTEKPQGLLKILIEMSTDPGDWIVDPYAGSSSALLAARDCGRNAVGIEREDDYYSTGLSRLSSGSLFDV